MTGDDEGIEADDGTTWVNSPHSSGLEWTGFVRDEEGCWLRDQAFMDRYYPDVVESQRQVTESA